MSAVDVLIALLSLIPLGLIAVLLLFAEYLDWHSRLEIMERKHPKLTRLINDRPLRLVLLFMVFAMLGMDLKQVLKQPVVESPKFTFPVPQVPAIEQSQTERIKKAQQEAQAERDDARHWREAYEGVTRGDRHPDRHLDSEDQRRLREQLRRIAKEPRNKDYIKIDFGMSSQIESAHLGWQLYQIFREEGWNLPSKPKSDVPKELQAEFQGYGGPNYAQGILIFTDDPQNRGRYLSLILEDCCRLDAIVNPRGIPLNFKGTLLWVGVKQYETYRDEH